MNQHTSTYVPALGFHFLTPLYDGVVAATVRERAFKSALVAQTGVAPGQRVLDLACGTGTLALMLKRATPEAEVFGIDGDPRMLTMARRKAGAVGCAIQFDTGMSTELPYPPSHFDRVTSSLFFHHLGLADKERTARELLRVIKPGGELHVADWGRPANGLMRAAFLGIQLLDGFENTTHNCMGLLPGLFEEAGFVVVTECRRFSTVFGTMSLYDARRPG